MKFKVGSQVYHSGDGNGVILAINPKDKDFQALVKFGTCHLGWFPFKQLEKSKL